MTMCTTKREVLIMSDHLKSFQNSNGSTSQQGQLNAGAFEHSQGWKPAAQQPWESADAYTTRVNQHNHLNNKSGG